LNKLLDKIIGIKRISKSNEIRMDVDEDTIIFFDEDSFNKFKSYLKSSIRSIEEFDEEDLINTDISYITLKPLGIHKQSTYNPSIELTAYKIYKYISIKVILKRARTYYYAHSKKILLNMEEAKELIVNLDI
jgi:hypothetical protein